MIKNKKKNTANAKIGRIWSTKNRKEKQDNIDDNFIIGMTNQTTEQNSE